MSQAPAKKPVQTPVRQSGVQQIPTQTFISVCGKMRLTCDSNSPLGDLHDFLMWLKGIAVRAMSDEHLNGETITYEEAQVFVSPCKKVVLSLEEDTFKGAFHDFIMALKGDIVTRMVEAQQQEEAVQKAQREKEESAQKGKKKTKK